MPFHHRLISIRRLRAMKLFSANRGGGWCKLLRRTFTKREMRLRVLFLRREWVTGPLERNRSINEQIRVLVKHNVCFACILLERKLTLNEMKYTRVRAFKMILKRIETSIKHLDTCPDTSESFNLREFLVNLPDS